MTAFEGFPRDGFAYSAADVGEALAGLIRRDSSGLPVPGMLSAPVVTVVPTSWKVEVSPFTFVSVSGASVVFSGLSGAEQVDIAPATGIPAGQGRIDVVCWDAAGDELFVVEGVVSGSPVAPSTSGLEPVVHVRVNSGDGMVIAGQVTKVYARSGIGGARSEKRTVPITLSGPTGSGAGASWRDFVTVQFEVPFTEAPHLDATAVFNWNAVQQIQVTSVTATGFSGRVIRLANTTPTGGLITYTATEK